MKYIKKYEVVIEILCKQNPKDTKKLIINLLKNYFLEGKIKKIEQVKMTKKEIENWEDFDNAGED